jgi:hypothetical protein
MMSFVRRKGKAPILRGGSALRQPAGTMQCSRQAASLAA